MRIFANKSLWKKIVIIFLLIISVSFTTPKPVQAGWGGELMEPICDLLVGLADGFVNITHHILMGQETTLIKVNLNITAMDILRVAVTAFVFLAVMAAAAALTAGGALAIGAVVAALGGPAVTGGIAVSAIIANIVPILVGATYFGVRAYSMDAFDNELALPLYSISPERIFSNTIPFFDVDFFNPSAKPFEYEWIHKTTDQEKAQVTRSANGKYVELDESDRKLNLDFSNGTPITEQLKEELKLASIRNGFQIEVNGKKYVQYEYKEQEQSTDWIKITKKVNEATSDDSATGGDETAKGLSEKHSITYELANVVAKWYYIIRTIAIVGMMSVLVYIGIRILLSSTSNQKAKYKQLLGDWVIGMVLLFTMHYIMIFSNIAVEHLTALFKNINPMGQTALIPDDNDKVENELKEYNIGVVNSKKELSEDNMEVYKFEDGKGNKYIEWNTDLMGQLRIALQANRDNNETYIGYTIMYIVMILYTIIFCFTYIKRVIYMAFLTIISPLVALTYPIDKVNDGSAQGFNYWFKEYIFNLLLQPLHLLIYTILVSTAIKFASENIIYSLISLGFIASAEKIVRQMFNFSKASTPGIFAGPAGAAMAMTGMRWLMGHGPKGVAGSKGIGNGSGSGSSEYAGITSSGNKTTVRDGMSALLGQGENNGEGTENGNASRKNRKCRTK